MDKNSPYSMIINCDVPGIHNKFVLVHSGVHLWHRRDEQDDIIQAVDFGPANLKKYAERAGENASLKAKFAKNVARFSGLGAAVGSMHLLNSSDLPLLADLFISNAIGIGIMSRLQFYNHVPGWVAVDDAEEILLYEGKRYLQIDLTEQQYHAIQKKLEAESNIIQPFSDFKRNCISYVLEILEEAGLEPNAQRSVMAELFNIRTPGSIVHCCEQFVESGKALEIDASTLIYAN